MAIIDKEGINQRQPWLLSDESKDWNQHQDILLSYEDFMAVSADRLSQHPKKCGMLISGDTNFTVLENQFKQLKKMPYMIQIVFPSFSDGRGFSLARQLSESGVQGEIRAYGPLLPDQYSFLRQCGFRSVEIPNDVFHRHGEESWLKAGLIVTYSYQNHYATKHLKSAFTMRTEQA